MTQVRVNVRSLANAKAARKEKRNGRDVVVVPSATLPDDIVMNGILYPKDEIAKSFGGLNRTFAPLGHPTINGQFISARDPEGINVGYIGAWNENARQEGGRVLLDKVIDVEVANRTEGGKAVLAAIAAGGPIHTSTGLFCVLHDNEDADKSAPRRVAKDIEFDHDAILLDEDGAATPAQGVGMLVNGQQIEVINSAIEDAERELDWAADMAARAVERLEKAPMLARIKAAIVDAIRGSGRETEKNAKENDMTDAEKQQLADLSAKVNALSDTVGKLDITAAVNAAVKPLIDNLDALAAANKAKDDAELAEHVAAIVKANILDETAAKELTLNAARKLAEKAKPGKAAGLNAAFTPETKKTGFKLPKGEEK